MASMTRRVRTAVLVGALWAAQAVAAADAAGRNYAVLSLVFDEITVVIQRPGVGSNLNRNDQRKLALQDPALDEDAASAAGTAILRREPGSRAFLLAWSDPGLYELQESLFDKQQPYLQALKEVLKKTQATHLLLITKHRADAALQVQHTSLGTGKLRGVGFYVDDSELLRLADSGDTGRGYLAPYAYLMLTLLDAQTGETIRKETLTEAAVVPGAGSGAENAWTVLTAQQKVTALKDVVRRAIEQGVPRLLDAR
jgi:hypothetical protein